MRICSGGGGEGRSADGKGEYGNMAEGDSIDQMQSREMNRNGRAYLFKRVFETDGYWCASIVGTCIIESRACVWRCGGLSRLQYLISALSSATKRTAPSLGERWIDSFCGLALGVG